MESRNIVIGAVLIAVIIVAGVIIATRATTAQPQVPARLLNQQVEKIDMNSLEVVTAPLGDWLGKYAADASGRYKNPKTGKYTMVDVMKCAACGQPIPVPQLPAEIQGIKGMEERRAAVEKFSKACKCPRCQKNPFGNARIPDGN